MMNKVRVEVAPMPGVPDSIATPDLAFGWVAPIESNCRLTQDNEKNICCFGVWELGFPSSKLSLDSISRLSSWALLQILYPGKSDWLRRIFFPLMGIYWLLWKSSVRIAVNIENHLPKIAGFILSFQDAQSVLWVSSSSLLMSLHLYHFLRKMIWKDIFWSLKNPSM